MFEFRLENPQGDHQRIVTDPRTTRSYFLPEKAYNRLERDLFSGFQPRGFNPGLSLHGGRVGFPEEIACGPEFLGCRVRCLPPGLNPHHNPERYWAGNKGSMKASRSISECFPSPSVNIMSTPSHHLAHSPCPGHSPFQRWREI